MGLGRRKEGTAHPEGCDRHRRAGHGLRPPGWSAGTGRNEQAQCLGWGPESGGSRQPLLQPSASGPPVPLGRFSRAAGMLGSQPGLRGAGIPAGGVLKNTGALLQNTRWGECRVLVPLKKKETGESAPSPQGLIAEQFDSN